MWRGKNRLTTRVKEWKESLEGATLLVLNPRRAMKLNGGNAGQGLSIIPRSKNLTSLMADQMPAAEA